MLPQHSSADSRLWVHVAHLPKIATEDWLRGLFVPIGTAIDVYLNRKDDPISAQVRFATVEEAAAALQYDGFRTAGQMLRVTPKASESLPHPISALNDYSQDEFPVSSRQRLPRTGRETDPSKTYRNLYVGNLPLNVNTDQLAALFGQYGNVTHCVILSTLDTQARRRGFIVMASSDESRLAIKGLNGFVWYGYPIEVSYALVQRSGGPLDPEGESAVARNVPRSRYNMVPRNRADGDAMSVGDNYSVGSSSISRAGAGAYSDLPNLAIGQKREVDEVEDPHSIVVSGLDPVAVIDNDDLLRIMLPHGSVAAATLCRDERGASKGFGIVTFEKEQDATRACAQLNQRDVHGRRLRAQRYVYSSPAQSIAPTPASVDLPWRSSTQNLPFSLPATPISPAVGGASAGIDRSLSASIHAPRNAGLPFPPLKTTSGQTSGLSQASSDAPFASSWNKMRTPASAEAGLAGLLSSMKLGTGSATSAFGSSGSKTAPATGIDRGSVLDNAPFFQPSRKSTQVSIRPDPFDSTASVKPSDLAKAPELGAAFEQRPKTTATKEAGEASTRPDRSGTENDSSLGLRTGLSLSPWSTNSGGTSNTCTPSPSGSSAPLRTPEQTKDRQLGFPFLPGTTSASLTKATREEVKEVSSSIEKAVEGSTGDAGKA